MYRVLLPMAERRVNVDDALIDADTLEVTASGALVFWQKAPVGSVASPTFLRAYSPTAWHSVYVVREVREEPAG